MNLNLSRSNKSFADLTKLKGGEELSVMQLKINNLIMAFNYLSKSISLDKNFSNATFKLEFAAGETKIISHLLGVTPKYRIILTQEGNGVLSDIPSRWNDKVAVILNNGAVTVTATIMFLKE